MHYIRNPLNVERWGKLETWEGTDAAYIIGGTEPEYGPDATLTNKGAEAHRAILASMSVQVLMPIRVTESGTYFLAAEVVRWANEKGFDLPQGLEAAVESAARAYVARHNAAKEALMREGAFPDDSLGIWNGKDLWSEEEFVALLCGVKPESFAGNVRAANYRAEQAASKAIQRAITVGTLDSFWEVEPSKYEWGKVVPSRTVQYFTPANAIRWAKTKRAEFPKFPGFPQVLASDDDLDTAIEIHREPVLPNAALPVLPTKNDWSDANLRTLYTESIMPGATPDKLAEKYGISRQGIEKQIKKAERLFKVGGKPKPTSLAWKSGTKSK